MEIQEIRITIQHSYIQVVTDTPFEGEDDWASVTFDNVSSGTLQIEGAREDLLDMFERAVKGLKGE